MAKSKGKMKKTDRDKIKSMPVNELQNRLQQLETERFKLETYMFRNDGSSVLTRNYPSGKTDKPYKLGNLRELKKNIARLKTALNIKMR